MVQQGERRRRRPQAGPAHSPAPASAGDLALPTPPGVVRRYFSAHPRRVDATLAVIYCLFTLLIVAATAPYSLSTNNVVFVSTSAPSSAVTPEPSTPGTTSRPSESTVPQPQPDQTADAVTATDSNASSDLWRMAGYVILTGIITAAIWLRRRWVIASAVVVLVCSSLQVPLLKLGLDPLAQLTALYALAVFQSARAGWWGFAAASTLAWVMHAETSSANWIVTAILLSSLYLAATAVFVNLGNRRRYTHALIDRAEALARERDQKALLAVAAERTRIAREMHDVVSHSLTVMVTLADGALAQLERSPEQARAALTALAETGRGAASEMRRMLGVLRDDYESRDVRTPQPTQADIWQLIEQAQHTGLPVHLQMDGTPPQDPGVQLAAYRIVQESLTNAMRYAHGATHVAVRLSTQPDGLHIQVWDNGVGDGVSAPPGQVARTQVGTIPDAVPPVGLRPDAGAPGPESERPGADLGALGTGNGLAGLKERAAVYGGELTAGPAPGGGWIVAARLPVELPGPDGDGAGHQ